MRDLLTALGGLTVRGRCFLAAGFAASASATILGERDLLRVGILLLVLPLVAAIVVARTRYRLACRRSLLPRRIAAGGTVTVGLRLDNVSRAGTSVLMVSDEIAGLGNRARFVLDGIPTGGRRSMSYPLRAELRGRYQIGPLSVLLGDPFGLCELTRSFRGHDELVVTPPVEDLPRLRLSRSVRLTQDGSTSVVGFGGDDIATRAYRHGDDLRRVHWRSTARVGELMVRQEEQSRAVRGTVLLDTRESAWVGTGPTSSFEWAVGAAASVAALLRRSGYPVRLVDAAGDESATAAGGVLLDELADISPAPVATLGPALRRVRETSSAAGLLVAVLGSLDTATAAAVARARTPHATCVAIVVDTTTWGGGRIGTGNGRGTSTAAGDADAARAVLARAGWIVVVARYGDTLARLWPRALGGTAPAQPVRERGLV